MNPQTIAALDDYLDGNIPVYIETLPGCGKSTIVPELVSRRGWYSEALYASGREPSEIGGMPVNVPGDGVVFAMPGYAKRLWSAHEQGKTTVLIIEEATTCHPAIQAPILRLVREGRFDDWSLPPGCRRVALGNPPDLAGWDLSAAMGNRFGHLSCQPDLTFWSEWNMNQPDPHNKRAKVSGFLKSRPGLFIAPLADWSKPGPKPSPRTWDMLCQVRTDEASAGLVGLSVYAEYLQWERAADLPDPEAVILGKAPVPERDDARYATFLAIVSFMQRAYESAKDKKAVYEKFGKAAWAILIAPANAGRVDEVLVPARTLAKSSPFVPPELGKLAPALQRIAS